MFSAIALASRNAFCPVLVLYLIHYYIQDQSLWAIEYIVFSFNFCFWINLCGQTRRSWFNLFSFSGLIFVWWRYFQIVPCWHMWLACLPFFFDLGDTISPTIFLYRSAIAVLSAHKVAGDEVTVSPITQNCSRVVFLVSFGLASLPFLVNDGSDKPGKYWRSIYVVGITWGEVEVCLVKMMYGEAVVKEVILTGIVILHYCNPNYWSRWVTIMYTIINDLCIYFRTYLQITWLQRH